MKYADGCFVVTQALQDYMCERYKTKENVEFYKVPCATSTSVIPEQIYARNRKKYREKYGIDDDTKVFIYSGGVSIWQCIEETLLLYKKIRSEYKGKTKLLMFSHNIDQLRQLTGEDKEIIFDSYRPDELEAALCAGDFAFMLRKDCITNNVAFPNKYLEYVRSKMRIIATPYVYEIAEQIKKYELGYIYDFEDNISGLLKWINQAEKSQNIKEVLELNSFDVRLQDFAIRLDKKTI